MAELVLGGGSLASSFVWRVVSLVACSGSLAGCFPGWVEQPLEEPSRSIPVKLELPASAHLSWLDVRVLDGATDRLLPSRLTVRPVAGAGYGQSILSGTIDEGAQGVRYGSEITPGVFGSSDGVTLENGAGSIPFPTGRWQIVVTRGPEYEAILDTVVLGRDERREVTYRLDRVVDTTGWLAADLHFHTWWSFDSRVSPERTAAAMVSNGVEVAALTDHHRTGSLDRAGVALGYGPDLVRFVGGTELNFPSGHATVLPLRPDELAHFGGGIPWEPRVDGGCAENAISTNCLKNADALALAHTLDPNALVILAHPFAPDTDLGHFNNSAWGYGTKHPPPAPMQSANLFDGLELINGSTLDPRTIECVLGDWFFLLGQGRRMVGVTGSDAHSINVTRAGWPRTMLRIHDEMPGFVTDEEIADALRNGRAIATTGPFLRVHADSADVGDTLRLEPGSPFRLTIEADAPEFVSLDDFILFVDGVERERIPVPPIDRHPRIHVERSLTQSQDGFVVVVALGRTPVAGDIAGKWWPVYPIAITNPIFLDANGDGRWEPKAVRPVMPHLYRPVRVNSPIHKL